MSGLYVPRGGGNFWQMGQQHARSAMGAYGSQIPERKTELNPPGKTAGGGMMAGAGGAVAGYSISSSNPYGAAVGAGLGIIAYLLS